MPAMLLFGRGAILLMIFFSAMQGIYVAALYRYATEGRCPSGFDSGRWPRVRREATLKPIPGAQRQAYSPKPIEPT